MPGAAAISVDEFPAEPLPRPVERPDRAWAMRIRGRPSADFLALLIVAAAVVIANLPALLGLFHLDPLAYRAGLSASLRPGLIGGRPTIDPSNGFNSQAIGHLAALDLLHLHLPWWNPYEGTGMPLLGETQSASLFPPTLLLALANGQLYEHVLLELVAGICTYLLLRRLDLMRPAAVAGAVAFALNGKFAWFSDATVNPLAFLPMLLLGIERAYDAARSGGRAGWRLIAVAVALTAYAGFPEVAYPGVLMGVAWVIWRAGCLRGSELGRFAAKAVLGAAAGVLIAAPILLAMFDYLSHADLVSHVGTKLGSRHLPFSEVPQLLMPYIFGPLNTTRRPGLWVMVGGYVSVILILFAVLGLIGRRRWGLKVLLLGWTLLVFGHMYEVPGVGAVLGALPEISRTQFYRYATAALAMPIIILAALGLDDARRFAAHRPRLILGAAGGVAAITAAGLAAQRTVGALQLSVPHVEEYFRVSVGWALGTVVAVAIVALVPRLRARGALLALIVVLDTVALFAVPQFAAPRSARLDLAPIAYLQRHLGDQRFYTLGPLRPNYGSYFGLDSIRLDDFPPTSFAHYFHHNMDPWAGFVGFRSPHAPSLRHELLNHLEGYRRAGVRYVLVWTGGPLPAHLPGVRLVFSSSTTKIYRLAHAARLFSAHGCQVSSSQLDSVSVFCRRPTTLVRRETWFQGWSARIDGRPAPIREVDGLFQAVRLPAGEDRVSFRFEPVDMDWALIALLAGCVLSLVPTARRLVARDGLLRPARSEALATAS